MATSTSWENPPPTALQRLLRFVIGAAIVTTGVSFFWSLNGRAIVRSFQSADWAEVPCEILASRMDSTDAGDETYFHTHIRFQYEYQSQTYEGKRYSYLDSSISEPSYHKDIVRRYPAGSQRRCFVNPEHPSWAVLQRGVTWNIISSLLFSNFIYLLLIVIGVGVMFYGVFGKRPIRNR